MAQMPEVKESNRENKVDVTINRILDHYFERCEQVRYHSFLRSRDFCMISCIQLVPKI